MWCRSRRVPSPWAVRMNSTCDEPGGKSSLPAIPHDTTTRRGRFEFEIPATDRCAVDVDRELSAGNCVQLGVLAHPRQHPFDGHEVLVHDFGRRVDVDRRGEVSHVPAALLPPLPA